MAGQAQQAIDLIRQGRSDEARTLCETRCRDNPADADAWFVLAGIHAQSGRLAEVVDCCQRVIALQPASHPAYYNLGVALQALGRHPEATEAYRQLLQLQPAMPQAHANLAMSLFMARQLEAAERSAHEAIRLSPEFAEAHNNLGLILKERGDLAGAEQSHRLAIQKKPALAQAHYNLGLCLGLQQRHEEAEQAFREALRLAPGYAEAWNDLGATLHRLGRQADAVQAYEQALQLRPDYAEALNNLGVSLLDSGQEEQAADRFRAALALRPNHARALNNLGNLLVRQGKLDEALEHYRRALQASPDYAEAHNNLGNALLHLDRFDEAITHLRKAVALKPDFAAAHNALGNALLAKGDPRIHQAEAERAFRAAIQHAPESADSHFYLGCCLRVQGRVEDALESFRTAEQLRPGYPDAIAGQASLFEHTGDFDQGMALIQPHIDQGTVNLQIALAYGALARHFDRREEAIALLERHLEEPDSLIQSRMQAHFLLGKLYDELKDRERSFTHYRRANDLDPNRFDRARNEQQFRNIISSFPADRQRVRPRASNKSRLPVFIVGMPRSGTSLVEQILASHPDVHGAGELEDMHKLTLELPKLLDSALHFPLCMDQVNRKTLDTLAKKHLDRLSSMAPRALRVTDKMPHNFQGLGLIELLFPGAQIIHCVRNPVDTCLSIYFQHFNADHAYANDLEELGHYHREYQRLMQHWRDTLTLPMLEIRYEDLVDDVETHSRRMIEFCGLKWNEACLEFHASKRLVKTPSYDQVRRPIYRKSVERWRQYEQHLAPLLEALGIPASETNAADAAL